MMEVVIIGGVVHMTLSDAADAYRATYEDPDTIWDTDHPPGGCIYFVMNRESKKLYIGKTRLNPYIRWYQHRQDAALGSTAKFHVAMREGGFSLFEFQVFDTAETSDELSAKEAKYIKQFNTVKDGYNTILPNVSAT